MSVWWLSFANDGGFLGGALVRGDTFPHAIAEAHRLGINPGGEVQGVELPGDDEPPDHEMNRLYSKAELESELGGAVRMDDAFE